MDEMHESTRHAVPPTSLLASEVDSGARDDWLGVKHRLVINLALAALAEEMEIQSR